MRDITQDIYLNNVIERIGIELFIIYAHAFLNIKVLIHQSGRTLEYKDSQDLQIHSK